MQTSSADDEDSVEFKVRLDLRTVDWLCRLADACHAPPAVVAAAVLRDVRQDDEVAHGENAPTTMTLN